jgi:hypothetical protein
MIRRLLCTAALSLGLLLIGSTAAFACGGLVAPGHAEVLRRATTLSAWHNGYEHYVTGFQFAGTASTFGYIVPLPGVPSKIEKGGGWTLERLEREITPRAPRALLAAGSKEAGGGVQVLQQVKIDALDISVVRGGGKDVADWAKKNGFDLTPDTGRVLSGYSSEGAVFALAKFDRVDAAARGLIEGQGATIHFTIPMKAPWIPLRILALGKAPAELIDADLFILTDRAPFLRPGLPDMPGMTVKAFQPASDSLLKDLRSDRGMSWLPSSGMWFTALSLHTPARAVGYDLSINGGGPHGLSVPPAVPAATWMWWLAVAALGGLVVAVARRGRPKLSPA